MDQRETKIHHAPANMPSGSVRVLTPGIESGGRRDFWLWLQYEIDGSSCVEELDSNSEQDAVNHYIASLKGTESWKQGTVSVHWSVTVLGEPAPYPEVWDQNGLFVKDDCWRTHYGAPVHHGTDSPVDWWKLPTVNRFPLLAQEMPTLSPFQSTFPIRQWYEIWQTQKG